MRIIKRCCKCQEEKGLSEYTIDKSRKDGVDKYCRNCKHIIGKAYYKIHYKEINLYSRGWRLENLERDIKNKKKHRLKNRKKVLAYQREYYQKNKEKAAVYQREYQKKNRTKINERQRKYEKEHPKKTKKYYQDNKEKLKEYGRDYYYANRDKILAQRKE